VDSPSAAPAICARAAGSRPAAASKLLLNCRIVGLESSGLGVLACLRQVNHLGGFTLAEELAREDLTAGPT